MLRVLRGEIEHSFFTVNKGVSPYATLPTFFAYFVFFAVKNSSPYNRGRDESSPYMTFALFVANFLFFFHCGSARRGHADRFGATVKEINSLMRLTSFKRRKQARRSLICLSGSSGAASGRNLRSCSASVINRLKWPRW